MNGHVSWIGVDLDGTLAENDRRITWDYIGPPVGAMLRRIKEWLRHDVPVRIFTARVSPIALAMNGCTREQIVEVIEQWCRKYIGVALPVTNEKDPYMCALWDDNAIQIESNTGHRVDGLP